jgi:hypothetical protein
VPNGANKPPNRHSAGMLISMPVVLSELNRVAISELHCSLANNYTIGFASQQLDLWLSPIRISSAKHPETLIIAMTQSQ